ncbi:MAG: hypothetical protein ACTHM5_09755 [Ginsengibacter sp.]
MSKEKRKEKEKKVIKKNARNEAYNKLLSVFSEYKNDKDLKKFNRKIEKAAKLLAPIIIKAKPETVSSPED